MTIYAYTLRYILGTFLIFINYQITSIMPHITLLDAYFRNSSPFTHKKSQSESFNDSNQLTIPKDYSWSISKYQT